MTERELAQIEHRWAVGGEVASDVELLCREVRALWRDLAELRRDAEDAEEGAGRED